MGFRHFVVHNARELDVAGTVRNREDGAVEAVFQAADEKALDAILERLRQGPPAARVDAVEVFAEEIDRRHDTMRVIA